jgi:glutathione S-transferase
MSFKDLVAARGPAGFNAAIPLGQLPVLDLGAPHGVVTQSASLLRWAGRKAGLYPADADAALRVDEVMDVAAEAGAKAPSAADAEEKRRLREAYADGPLAKYCAFLEARVGAAGGPFLAGAALSVGDLSVYWLTDMLVTGDFDYIPSSYLDKFPGLRAHHAAVKASDVFVKYA